MFTYGFITGVIVTTLIWISINCFRMALSEKKSLTRLVNKDEDDDYGMVVPYIPNQD